VTVNFDSIMVGVAVASAAGRFRVTFAVPAAAAPDFSFAAAPAS
jgi:hypothetical protein